MPAKIHAQIGCPFLNFSLRTIERAFAQHHGLRVVQVGQDRSGGGLGKRTQPSLVQAGFDGLGKGLGLSALGCLGGPEMQPVVGSAVRDVTKAGFPARATVDGCHPRVIIKS